jgi:tetracycline resistance efflux pump
MPELLTPALSLVPPLLAIGCALLTRQVFPSLLLGLWSGYLILAGGNPLVGSLETLNALVDVFSSAGNTRTIIFSALMGALILLMQRSGGVQGFVNEISKRLSASSNNTQKSTRSLQIATILIGAFVFIETTISVLIVGTLFRPLYDRYKLSRERLAFLADSTSAPVSVLLPLNAWGAYILSLLAQQNEVQNPLNTLLASIPQNLYAICALSLTFWVALGGRTWGPLKAADQRASHGQVLNDNAQPMVSQDVTEVEPIDGVTPRASALLIPLLTLIITMPITLFYTGWPSAQVQTTQNLLGVGDLLKYALSEGSGSMAVLTAVCMALLTAGILYRIRGFMKMKTFVDTSLVGIGGLMPLALMMVFAFALSTLCKALGTGPYVAQLCQNSLPVALFPALTFLVSAFIAFATGTSWGTFAIMLPIAAPLAAAGDLSQSLLLSAVLGGGVFGDHASPISDTTLVSSMAAATDHLDHVRTQLPFALVSGGIATLFYLAMGLCF